MSRPCGLVAVLLAVGLLTEPSAVSPEPNAKRPIEALDTVFVEEMTWLEVRDALKAGKTTVIAATGGVEQNGPYLATGWSRRRPGPGLRQADRVGGGGAVPGQLAPRLAGMLARRDLPGLRRLSDRRAGFNSGSVCACGLRRVSRTGARRPRADWSPPSATSPGCSAYGSGPTYHS